MTAAQITSALGARRTVRVTYSRTTDLYRVDVCGGDRPDFPLTAGFADERDAERYAQRAAQLLGRDVTRLDVP